ncbi:MAG TPA: hypothetical protein VK540_16035 [Polyangiaceae bacterium]|nr:hypothetical protein [Polyangiaceae bacterium]
MSAATFFDAVDAPPLPPLGVCSLCGFHEDPMIAIFWAVDADGRAHCPSCSGEAANEGYAHVVCYSRRDRGNVPETMLGPYSAAEAARIVTYLVELDNIKSVRVAAKPEWWA